MNAVDKPVLYWDSSAVPSVLFQDEHSPVALKHVNHSGAVHLISSLALAETYAVISRVRRERLLADLLIRATVETLETGPWREIGLCRYGTSLGVSVPGTLCVEQTCGTWPW